MKLMNEVQELPEPRGLRNPSLRRSGTTLEEIVDQGGDALGILNLALSTDPLLLLPLVEEHLAKLKRLEVRSLESQAFSERSGDKTTLAVSRLLDECFTTGEKMVAWGEATVEDHQKRINFLRKYQDGLQVTIDRHQEAIRQITKAGVKCLNDL